MAIRINGKLVAGQGGVESFNGRTGAIAPQEGDYTAAQVSYTPDAGITSTNVQEALKELFISVSDGKRLVASAITDKGVETAEDATFETMRGNILALPSSSLPDNVHTITLTAEPEEGGTVSGGGLASDGMTITVKAKAQGDNICEGWKENDQFVSKDADYTFQVEDSKNLIAVFSNAIYLAGRDWWGANLPSSANWYGVTWGDGKFVTAASGSSKAAYSEDGVTWKTAMLPSSANWRNVTWGDGKFVTVASGSSKAAYSEDGITWKATVLPFSAFWFGVTWGDGKFVTVASGSSKAAYSEDGITWKAATLPSSANWGSVTWGDSKFVAVANNSNQATYSEDGITWEAATLPSSANWDSVTWGDGKFVAVANNSNQATYSEDGITWEAATLPSSANWYGVTWGDGKFVAVAYNSDKAAYSYTGN